MSSNAHPSTPPSRTRALAINLGLMLATVILLLAVVEATLRLTGFEWVLKPEDIEFGRPHREMIRIGFEEDPDLFWVPKTYDQDLRRIQQEQPQWVLLGDSCTQLGTYDRELARIADARGHRLSYGNLAVAGWSSYQGRQQLARDVNTLRPKVVTIFFGWNDHWIGFGLEDKTVHQSLKLFSQRWSRLRLVQLIGRVVVMSRAGDSGLPNRVSLQDFGANLRTMILDVRALGAIPLVITAPSNHRPGQEPEELARRWLRNLDELVPLHQSYVQTARDAAEQLDVHVCDLASQVDKLPEADRDSLFLDDGIHFTAAGSRWVAQALDTCFQRHNLWPVLTP